MYMSCASWSQTDLWLWCLIWNLPNSCLFRRVAISLRLSSKCVFLLFVFVPWGFQKQVNWPSQLCQCNLNAVMKVTPEKFQLPWIYSDVIFTAGQVVWITVVIIHIFLGRSNVRSFVSSLALLVYRFYFECLDRNKQRMSMDTSK